MYVVSDDQTEEDVSLSSLLMFWTGADAVPPGGFDRPLTVAFFTREEGEERRLPSSSTCGLVLMLPRGMSDPDKFKEDIVFALKNTCGFGRI